MEIGLQLSLLLTLASGCLAQRELFKNANFEGQFDGQNNWWGVGCQLSKAEGGTDGSQSGLITNRRADWGSVTQYVPIQPGRQYRVSIDLKLLNQREGKMWHHVNVCFRIELQDDTTEYRCCGASPFVRPDRGWMRLGGDCRIANKPIRRARFYLGLQEAEINYQVDKASLKEIPVNPSWRQEADARIESLRKRDVQIRFNAGPRFDPDLIEIRLEQTKSDFLFGSAMNAWNYRGTEPRHARYRDVFYELFGVAVMESSMKWQTMERQRGNINYALSENVVNDLEARGIPVRGHCVIWGKEQFVPDWVRSLDGDGVRQEVDRRVNYVVSRFKDRLIHWDVNNEQTHGPFFETKTGDPYYTEKVVRDVKRLDPNAKMFYNEYNVLNYGGSAYAFTEQVKHALQNNVPVGGVGLQSHMSSGFNARADVHAIWQRLNVAASAGKELWVTELSVSNPDVRRRAEGYEALLRLYFSHPAVEGVLLWGYWDGAHFKKDAALFEGPDVTPNEAGVILRRLLKETWRTNTTLHPSSRAEQLRLRAFLGDYRLRVVYEGQEVHSQSFGVHRGTGPVIVNVQI